MEDAAKLMKGHLQMFPYGRPPVDEKDLLARALSDITTNTTRVLELQACAAEHGAAHECPATFRQAGENIKSLAEVKKMIEAIDSKASPEQYSQYGALIGTNQKIQSEMTVREPKTEEKKSYLHVLWPISGAPAIMMTMSKPNTGGHNKYSSSEEIYHATGETFLDADIKIVEWLQQQLNTLKAEITRQQQNLK